MKAQICKLKLTLSDGEKQTSKTYSDINYAATNDQLKQAAEILGSLQTRTLNYISRIDETVISDNSAALV